MKKQDSAEPQKRVLIIEDDPDVSEILSLLIRGMGAQAVVAPDGKTGLELCRREQPDLAVVDLLLPGLSGVEVIRSIRSTLGPDKLPIIVITGNTTVENVRETAQLGADDFLIKANVLSGTGIDRIRKLLEKPLSKPPRRPTRGK